MKRFISFAAAMLLALAMLPFAAYAGDTQAESENQIIFTAQDFKDKQVADITAQIQSALNEAKSGATDEKPYKIYIPEGSYSLDSTLHIYSNTYLYLTDKTTLTQTASKGQNLIMCGNGEQTTAYNGYRNITVSGGRWNMNYNGSCAMRFGHAKNITVKDLTVTGIKNVHHIEVAAIDGFYLQGCTFTGQTRTDDNSAEAVQIDIMHEDVHFPSFGEYDDTPCKNVTVSGCTFDGVYSGVGTRSGVVGSYFTNIQITGNTFNNITERAITCFNYKNSKINNNTFSNVQCGIVFEYLPNSSTLENRLFKPNSGASPTISTNSSSEIKGNYISVSKLTSALSCGIYVYGSAVDSSQASDNSIPQGSYRIKNIDVSGNTVTCYGSTSRGIFVTGVNGSDISQNSLASYAVADDGINGINICGSKKNSIEGNVITGTFNNGISLYNDEGTASKNNLVSGNTVNGMRSYGIRVAGASYATVKNNNSFTNCGISTVCVTSENYSQSLADVSIKSVSHTGRGKPLIRLSGVGNGNTGYKIYRSRNGSSYSQVATVSGKDLFFEDKSALAGVTYYYRIYPYKTVNSTVIVAKNYVQTAV